jgi:CubicO group peptidase (beta-lactamase class C family)
MNWERLRRLPDATFECDVSQEARMRTAVIAACLVAAATLAACRRSTVESPSARVDGLFAEWNKADSPGCGVGVSQNGAVVYQRGYGLANVELGVPITPASVFPVASISKQFTAMSIMLLAQQGKLSLDDEVSKYVPGWADRDHRITIRHLLAHAAGLRDVFLLVELASPRVDGVNINDALMRILARQRGLNFTPGTEFRYNNGGYNLLAGIVKRVSGQSFRDFTDANIFKPLGMTHTHFHDDSSVIVPHRAWGYHREAEGLRLARGGGDSGGIVGNAGLFTTTGDLLLWEQNFADVRVGDRALVTEMQTPVALAGGGKSPYGLGLEVGQDHGLTTVGHGGGDAGVAAYVIRYPERALSVAVLCNLDNVGFAVGQLTRRVAALYLPEIAATSSPAPAAAAPAAPPPALSAEQLRSKTGLYRDAVNETVGRIFVRDGKLRASPGAGTGDEGFELIPVDETHFVMAAVGVAVEFVPATAGRPQEIRVTGDGPKPYASQLVTETPAPSRAALDAFAGDYRSCELDTAYAIRARDAGLVIQIQGRADIDLKPLLPDTFTGNLVGMVTFSRDPRGVVTGFTINANDVRGLRFDRRMSCDR